MRNEKGYRRLIAWQRSNTLAHLTYDITESFPKSELFGITSQMRRAVLSVCANIVEGYSRKTIKDRRHFYNMAVASLTELEFFIDFAYERKYIDHIKYKEILEIAEEAAKILDGLAKSARL